MHEHSIVRGLIDVVEAEARARGARRVLRLHVSIGEISGVDAGLIVKAFEAFRDRTICEGAAIAVSEVGISWVCSSCGRPVVRDGPLTCAACGSPARLDRGGEIVIDRIEMEVT